MSGWKDLWEDIVDARNIDFNDLDELPAADADDEIIINNVSEDEVQKIQVQNLILSAFPGFVITDNLGLVFTNSGGFVFYEG